jgi:hypothetical protein
MHFFSSSIRDRRPSWSYVDFCLRSFKQKVKRFILQVFNPELKAFKERTATQYIQIHNDSVKRTIVNAYGRFISEVLKFLLHKRQSSGLGSLEPLSRAGSAIEY